MTFGNNTVQTFGLNERLQIQNQELKRGAETLQKYLYGYGQIDTSTGIIAANSNNGQLAKVESYIGTAKQWEQRFGYDSLGRLNESREIRGDNSSLTYKQVFDFDRFGNMYRKAANNNPSGQANPLPYTPIEEATTAGRGDIEKADNRFRTNTSYDNAGNVVTDNKFRTMGFSYDANGRMVKATKVSTPDALSVYDAAGMRSALRYCKLGVAVEAAAGNDPIGLGIPFPSSVDNSCRQFGGGRAFVPGERLEIFANKLFVE